MRFALLVRASRESESCITPLTADADKLLCYATELDKAGVLLDAQGLQPTRESVRVVMTHEPQQQSSEQSAHAAANHPAEEEQGSSTTREKSITHFGGPFPADETISAWWIVEVADVQEAIKWAERSPFPLVGKTATVEIRKLFAPDDIKTKKPLTVEETAGSEAIQRLFRG
ncbi:hypothetical protein KEM52_006158 [Ascosphaera acerosa]|nr:hypothetical protein KEM52_006158 [Ascosphaera acerosa]